MKTHSRSLFLSPPIRALGLSALALGSLAACSSEAPPVVGSSIHGEIGECDELPPPVQEGPAECWAKFLDATEGTPGGSAPIVWDLETSNGEWIEEVRLTLVLVGDSSPIQQTVIPNYGQGMMPVPSDLDPSLNYAIELESLGVAPDSPWCATAQPFAIIEEPAVEGPDAPDAPDAPADDAAECGLGFDAPAEGFTVTPGGFVDLTWMTRGEAAPHVYLGVSEDGGISYLFEAVTSNEGSYLFIPPADAPVGTQYEVVLESADEWILNGACSAWTMVQVVGADDPSGPLAGGDQGGCEVSIYGDQFVGTPGGSVQLQFSIEADSGVFIPEAMLSLVGGPAGDEIVSEEWLQNVGVHWLQLPADLDPSAGYAAVIEASAGPDAPSCWAWIQIDLVDSTDPADPQ